jgi:hypothetical protein
MTAIPSDPSVRRLSAIGWLLLLHGMASILVGVYRCLDLDATLIDVLSAALTRSQIALLTIWFVLGRERWSWRLSGLVGGLCFLFSVMSGMALPGQWDMPVGAYWFPEEWAHYYRPAGPGDLLVKVPVMVPGIALPLMVVRFIGDLRRGWRPWPRDGWRRLDWLRFRFQDLAVWSVAISLVLVAVFQTAPYERWYAQLWEHGWLIYQMEVDAHRYSVISSGLYVWVAWMALWAAWGGGRARYRLAASLLLTMIPAIAVEAWAERMAASSRGWNLSSLWFQGTAETTIAVLAWLLIAGSLGLYRLYDLATARPLRGGTRESR